MDNTSGFYSYQNEELLTGKNIFLPTEILIYEDHETYTYPVQGWYWFDTEADARVFFNLPINNGEVD